MHTDTGTGNADTVQLFDNWMSPLRILLNVVAVAVPPNHRYSSNMCNTYIYKCFFQCLNILSKYNQQTGKQPYNCIEIMCYNLVLIY